MYIVKLEFGEEKRATKIALKLDSSGEKHSKKRMRFKSMAKQDFYIL